MFKTCEFDFYDLAGVGVSNKKKKIQTLRQFFLHFMS